MRSIGLCFIGLLLAAASVSLAAERGGDASQSTGSVGSAGSGAVKQRPVTKVPAPATAPRPAPSTQGKPGNPAVAIPKSRAPGLDRNAAAIRDANLELERLRDLEQLEKLNRSPLDRGQGTAPGLDLPGALPGGAPGSEVARPWERSGGSPTDPACMRNPSECLRRGATPGGAGGPPAAGAGVPDRRGMASDAKGAGLRDRIVAGQGEFRSSTVNRMGNGRYHYDNGYVDTSVERTADGNVIETFVTATDGEGSFRDSFVNDANGRRVAEYNETTDADGNGAWQVTFLDEEGNQIGFAKGRIENGQRVDPPTPPAEGGVAGGTGGGSASGPDSQPSEDPRTGRDNCGWHPLYGCLNRRDVQQSVKDMTRQPSKGGETDGGSAAGGRIGPEAVTNTGGSDWQTPRPGGSGGGSQPYDPRDPEEIVPGPDVGPSGPGGRAGSDAGLDAALGALPAPPTR